MLRLFLALLIAGSLGSLARGQSLLSGPGIDENGLRCGSDDPTKRCGQVAKVGEVIGGSFEEPAIFGPYQVFSSHGQSPVGWTIESGTIDIVGDYWEARKGKQSIDLSGADHAPGTIYQDVRTEKGAWYLLRFAVTGNPEPDDQPTIKKLRVYFDGVLLDELQFDVSDDDFQHVNWHYSKYKVQATGDIARIRFQSLTETMCGPILDDVSLTSISPPERFQDEVRLLSK